MNAWVYLFAGIVVEVIGTMSLKLSDGFSNLLYSVLSLSCFGVALFCIASAARIIDLSVAYAIWSGVGIILITLGSMVLFDEKMTLLKAMFIGLIIVGVVGLQTLMTGTGMISGAPRLRHICRAARFLSIPIFPTLTPSIMRWSGNIRMAIWSATPI